MLQVAGTMFLQSYRAGKYYNDENGIGILPSCSNACVAESGANEILFFAIPW
jgi:hypothetical protein